MYCISYHCSTIAKYSSNKFKYQQKQFAKLPIIVVLYIVFSLKWASFMIQIPFIE